MATTMAAMDPSLVSYVANNHKAAERLQTIARPIE